MAVAVSKVPVPVYRATLLLLLLLVVVSVLPSFSEAQVTIENCFLEIMSKCGASSDKFENVESMSWCCAAADIDKECACEAWGLAYNHVFNFPIQVYSCLLEACAAGTPPSP